MNAFDIIRAWKDEAYRASLSAAQLAAMPANPAGMIELAETDLDVVVGGVRRLNAYTDPGSGCGQGTGTGTGTGGGAACRNNVRRMGSFKRR
jgi:mersacidin/lichenicidin family type 2 lantibiotic